MAMPLWTIPTTPSRQRWPRRFAPAQTAVRQSLTRTFYGSRRGRARRRGSGAGGPYSAVAPEVVFTGGGTEANNMRSQASFAPLGRRNAIASSPRGRASCPSRALEALAKRG